VPAVSLSKTKNVPKLTSAISSSLRVICGGAVARDGVSAVCTALAADAPPASDKDTPTTPATGTASFRRFRFDVCFVCGMSSPPMPSRKMSDALSTTRTLCTGVFQDRLRTLTEHKLQRERLFTGRASRDNVNGCSWDARVAADDSRAAALDNLDTPRAVPPHARPAILGGIEAAPSPPLHFPHVAVFKPRIWPLLRNA